MTHAVTKALVARHPRFGDPDAHDDGVLQCHEMVALARALPEARGLAPVEWDESKWDEVSRILKKERVRWPRFRSGPPREVLVDVADGSTCGHSFLVDRSDRVVDPYMDLRGVPDDDVQKLGRYLTGVYRRAGF